MAINLSNVNISLNEFQRLSQGEYNAGEVRLASETKLTRMNHHITLTLLNNDRISHAEVIAIKQALINALSRNGVGGADLDRVRIDLGLAPKGKMDTGIEYRSILPLSRQKIREILDRYAQAINTFNANNPNGAHIRTSADIYGENGMAPEDAAERDKVNASLTDGSRIVNEDKRITRFQAVIANNADFCDFEERNKRLQLARDLLDALLSKCRGTPRENVLTSAELRLHSGQNIVVPTGLDEKAFVAHLEDLIIRLTKMRPPSQTELDVRQAYKRLPSQDDKQSFITELQNDPRGGLKARALSVMFLVNRGLQDWATLSLVNTISDEDAICLAGRLAAIPENTAPAQVRTDPIILSIKNKPAALVDDENQAYLPVLTNEEYNSQVRESLLNGDGTLLQTYQTLAEITRVEVRHLLGEKAIPDGLKLSSLVSSADMSRLCPSTDDAPRVTASGIAKDFLNCALREGAKRIVQVKVAESLSAIGSDPNGASFMMGVLRKRHPEIFNSVAEAKTPEDADEVVVKCKDRIDAFVRLWTDLRQVFDTTEQRLRQTLAEKLGVTTDETAVDLAIKKLKSRVSHLKDDIATGKLPLSTKEQFEAALKEIVDDFVNERLRYFDEVDKQNLPQGAKDAMKAEILSINDLKLIDITAIANAAKSIDVTELENLLKAKAPKTQVYDALKPIAEAIQTFINNLLSQVENPDYDDQLGPKNLIAIAIVRAHPGLDKLLDAFIARPDVKDEVIESFYETASPAARLDAFKQFSSNKHIWPFHASRKLLEKALFAAPRIAPILSAAGGVKRALDAGYYISELPMLEKTFTLYKAATNCSNEDALTAVLDPQGTARSLFAYGGRFTENAENFRKGLRLVGMFREWYPQTIDAVKAGDRSSPTKLNLKTQFADKPSMSGFEKFIFEELAHNPNANLDEQDPEAIFGMGNNKAMCFIALGYAGSMANTLATIPPDKRSLLFDVFATIDPLPLTEAESETAKNVYHTTMLLSRVLRNYDALATLRDQGNFDREHLVEMLYGDFGVKPTDDNEVISNAINAKLIADLNIMARLTLLLSDTGAPLDECIVAIKGGPNPKMPQWASSVSGELSGLGGNPDSARNTLMIDLPRASMPKRDTDNTNLIDSKDQKFVFNFPDGQTLSSKSGSSKDQEITAANNAIADKVAAFCGNVHGKQLASVYLALSQSALAPIKGGFIAEQISTDEHMAVTFTLAKDDDTGDITITYTEPKGFPFKFSWTTTVALDGTTSTTPIERLNG